MNDFEQTRSSWRRAVEDHLGEALSPQTPPPGAERLYEAMRYAVAGGKRIRPLLVLGGAEAVGADPLTVLPAAAGVELFHAYSLVHDDLPAMDDDAVRRGRPTVHRRYGEANAILVGDALLTLGFGLLANQARLTPQDGIIAALALLSEALGAAGMVGGQFLDLNADDADLAALARMQHLKTGALLSAAAAVGALLSAAPAEDVSRLRRFGLLLGQSYQVVDDLLDASQDARAGARHSASVLGHLEPAAARARAAALCRDACAQLEPLGRDAVWLRTLANRLLTRNN